MLLYHYYLLIIITVTTSIIILIITINSTLEKHFDAMYKESEYDIFYCYRNKNIIFGKLVFQSKNIDHVFFMYMYVPL